ncbi:E3 ubiquitin-protein ligase TOM1-like, partial [Neolecta irregularis DAH-3]
RFISTRLLFQSITANLYFSLSTSSKTAFKYIVVFPPKVARSCDPFCAAENPGFLATMQITKSLPKRLTPPPPEIKKFIDIAISSLDVDLPSHLSSLQKWVYPRGEMFHWIPVLNRLDEVLEKLVEKYELTKVQGAPFEDFDKSTLLSVLKFTSFLFDHSANRSLYNSSMHLNHLLHTTDIDVLEANLRLCLRMAQRIPMSGHAKNIYKINHDRIMELAVSWQRQRKTKISLVQLLQDDADIPEDWTGLSYQYFRQDPSHSPVSAFRHTHTQKKKEPVTPTQKRAVAEEYTEGIVAIEISAEKLQKSSLEHVVQQTITQFDLPLEHQPEFLYRVRLAKYIQDPIRRKQLVTCRLLALANAAYLALDSPKEAKLMICEPDIIVRLVEIIHPENHVRRDVQTIALNALEAFSHQSNAVTEVLTELNVAINHGILLSVLRMMIRDFQESKPVDENFQEAMFRILTYFITISTGSGMLSSAGLIPILVAMLDIQHPEALRAVSKCIGVIDHLIFGLQTSFQSFSNAQGLKFLVDRLQHEIDYGIKHASAHTERVIPQMDYQMPYERFTLIRTCLKFILRMLTTAGIADQLRNLIDTSLILTIGKVFNHSQVFGATIFATMTNIMATFVHNEPTSYAVIHESKLSHTFLDAVSHGFPKSSEVMGIIPHAFEAICLNAQGMELFKQISPMKPYFEAMLDEAYCRNTRDLESANAGIGQGFDEFLRHQPSLRSDIYRDILGLIRRVVDYGVQNPIPLLNVNKSTLVESLVETSEDVSMRDVSKDVRQCKKDDEEEVAFILYLNVVAAFVDGMLQNPNQVKEFLKTEGLDLLVQLYTSPGLPYDFGYSSAAYSLSHTFRLVVEAKPDVAIPVVLKKVREVLELIRPVLDYNGSDSFLRQFIDIHENDLDVAKHGNELIRNLISSHGLMMLLSDLYANPAISHGKSYISLYQPYIETPEFQDLIKTIGLLHRVCIWEDLMIIGTMSKDWNDATVAKSEEQPSENDEIEKRRVQAERAIDTSDPKFKNAKIIRFLISQIPSGITPTFQGLGRILISRRSSDNNQRRLSFAMGKQLAMVLIEHMNWSRAAARSTKDMYSYWIVMLTLIHGVLLDDRSSMNSNCSLLTCIMLPFQQNNGLESVLRILEHFWQEAKSVPEELGNENLTNEHLSSTTSAHVLGGLKVIFQFLLQITRSKTVIDAAQTQVMQARTQDLGKDEYFVPSAFLLRLRYIVFPTIQICWKSEHLIKLSNSLVKFLSQVLAQLLKGEGEINLMPQERESSTSVASFPAFRRALDATNNPRPPIQLYDESNVQALMEMGFSRGAVERALTRSRNRLEVATEWLLAHPEAHSLPPLSQSITPQPERPSSSLAAEGGSTAGDTEQVFPAPTVSEATVDEGNPSIRVPATQPTAPDDNSSLMNVDEESRPRSSIADPTGDVEMEEGPLRPQVVLPLPLLAKGKSKAALRRDDTEELIKRVSELRNDSRATIIERALDILQAHPDVSYDISKLIIGASDGSIHQEWRLETTTVIIESIRSLAGSRTDPCKGLALTSVIHLFGLLIHEKPYYSDASAAIQADLPLLVEISRVNDDESPPWSAHVFLIFEELLNHSDQPIHVTLNQHGAEEFVARSKTPIDVVKIDLDVRIQIFENILKVLQTQPQDKNLVITVLRLLVRFTRQRELATRMVQDGALANLFGTIRKLSGQHLQTIQVPLLLVLRHIVEDESILRSIIRTQIRAACRPSRYGTHATDMTVFMRSTAPVVLRDPDTFSQIITEQCKLAEGDLGISQHFIDLRSPPQNKDANRAETLTDSKESHSQDSNTKPPGVEHPDGVIHFLVTELLALKDIADGEPEIKQSDKVDDAETHKEEKKVQDFKLEENSDFLYRLFLLQCLTELLGAYNRCKLEFINFSRRAHPRETITPSKPRSTILNHLLYDLIPYDVNDSSEALKPHLKKLTSDWAMWCIGSLLSHTGELPKDEETSDFIFVRKFALEGILKAFKEDTVHYETLDARYTRYIVLSELIFKCIVPKENIQQGLRRIAVDTNDKLEKLMFEKNYINVLTSVVSDVDLNFPTASRVARKILKPLKHLTSVASKITETRDVNIGDEISIAESLSDAGSDGREETPDFYRNSSLGMLHGDMEETEGSEEFDENQDEDMYDEMDFDEEMSGSGGSGGSAVSDEESEHEHDLGHDDMNVEVVLEEEDDSEDSDDESHSDEDTEASADRYSDTGGLEVVADDENEGQEEWQTESEGSNEHESEAAARRLASTLETMQQFPGGGAVGRAREDPFNEEIGEESDDEEADMDGDDGFLDGDDDDEEAMDDFQWSWGPDLGDGSGVPTIRPRSHRFVSRHVRGLEDVPMFRRNRIDAPANRNDEWVSHPLLQNPATNQRANPISGAEPDNVERRHAVRLEQFTDWVQSLQDFTGNGGVHVLGDILSRATARSALQPGGIRVELTTTGPVAARELEALFGGRAALRNDFSRSHVKQQDTFHYIKAFLPATTSQRWQDEARIMYGNNYLEIANRSVNIFLNRLLPEAHEVERLRKETQARAIEDRRAQAEKKAAEEADQQRIKAEEEAVRVAKEEAERKAREEEERIRAGAEAEAEASNADNLNEAMEGVERNESVDQPAGGIGPSIPTERRVVNISGREFDITDLEIDVEFLEALPEEMREEVLTQAIREQRPERLTDQSTEINQEFLDALPAEIRAEILAQEASDRSRRSQQSRRGQDPSPGASHTNAQLGDLGFPDLITTLDPALRNSVLAEHDGEVLSNLPPHLLAETSDLRRALPTDMRDLRGGFDGLQARYGALRHAFRDLKRPTNPPDSKSQKKDAVQLLDKSGISALIRLVFLLQNPIRTTLSDVLLNVCENKHNRAEVVTLLLSVLQDATYNLSSIEKSFAQLTSRVSKNTPSTPKSASKQRQSGFPTLSLSKSLGEDAPNLVTQQCIFILNHLVVNNEHLPSFFLNEHETAALSLKRSSSRKGKGKEPARNSKYPVNTLLGLLDRSIILDNSSTVETFARLLSIVTRPLMMLLRKDRAKDLPKSGSKEDEKMKENLGFSEVTHTQDPNTSLAAPEILSIAKKDDSEGKRKTKTLQPPQIAEANIKLICNILKARDCGSKTFQYTLATMQHLSALPEAKQIFAIELAKSAQDLSGTILPDLEELLSQIQGAPPDSEINGQALSRFSPASSHQTKLLRILKAIDYLFDRNAKPPAIDSDREEVTKYEAEKSRIHNAYQQLSFGMVWKILSECLSAVRSRPENMHIASVLLPLIEALMVVCKNAGIKDAKSPSVFRQTILTRNDTMETLFFNFTEEHRKILNQMVRATPSLMSGSFALLVQNPKVLEFDNKRNYFSRKLHEKANRENHGVLQLNIRRDLIFLDSYRALYFKSGDEMKYSKLNIRFAGEDGIDAGGLTREWYQALARQMFNPDYALFTPVASDRTTFHPNRTSAINPEHLSFFKFVGRIIGKALYDGRLLDCHFSRAVYKHILGKPVALKDIETLDLDYYKSLQWMLENDITDIITETFSIESDEYGERKIVDLIPNGRSITVTEENKHEYVRLVVEYRLNTSIQDQLSNFLTGFTDIIPEDLVKIFNEQELELLISGLPDIDVDDWRNNTEYHNYNVSSPQIQWFWRAVRSFDPEERAKLLQFATGTSKVPLNGFKELEGMGGQHQRFNIHRDYGSADRLPQSHTCFNQVDLPEYETYEQLRSTLLKAITETQGFAFA